MESRKLVSKEEWLWRRSYCNPLKRFENPDGTAHSRVFKVRESDKGELSVNVKSLTTIAKTLPDPTNFIIFEISNQSIIEIGLMTYHDRLVDGSNDAHAVILMDFNDDISPSLLAKKSKRLYL